MSKQIQLEEKDKKKLGRRRLFMFIFFIYMSIVTLAVMGFAVWLYYFDQEEIVGPIMGVGSLFGVFATALIYRSWSNLKKDLSKGVKEVINGEIAKKYSHKNNHELTINGNAYKVNYRDYLRFKKGEHVLIAYAPMSRIILDIHELPMNNKKN